MFGWSYFFFFSTYKVQEVSALKTINQKLNNALDLSEQYMVSASVKNKYK
jgi:hypothetical protein